MPDSPKTFAVSPRLKVTCWVLLVLSFFGLAATTYLAITHKTMPLPYEQMSFGALNGLPESIRPFMLTITYLGSVWAFVAIACIATISKRYRLAWWLSLSVLLAYGLSYIMKILVERSRPDGLLADVSVRVGTVGYGFPSMHATVATVLSLTLFFYLPKGFRWFIVPLWITSVAISRVYLGVHSTVDVLAGVFLGVFICALLRLLPRGFKQLIKLCDKTPTGKEAL
jgi:membrane-associated phospholipid phosphatase